MFHSRDLNNRINRIHERALRIAYKDQTSSFTELLRNAGTVTVHHKNIQLLVAEVYKFINGLSPKIMGEIFQIKENNYNLRTGLPFKSYNINTVHYRQNSISYLAPRVWALFPQHIKSSPSFSAFKRKIRNWVPEDCPCRLFERYLPFIGFI